MIEAGLMQAIRLFTKLMSVLDLTDRRDRVLIEQAIQSLRQIFFFPSDLRVCLNSISRGEAIDDDLLEELIEHYRDVHAPHIQDALSFLRGERFQQSRRLFIEDLEMFEEIARGKTSLRRRVKDFLRGYASSPRENDWPTEASRILGQIELLNTEIKRCEKQLEEAVRADLSRSRPPSAAGARSAKKVAKRSNRST